jgi:AAA ATPase domain
MFTALSRRFYANSGYKNTRSMKDEEQTNTNFNYYQIANAATEAVKAGFLVRQYEYGVILEDLLRHPGKGSVQHYLLLGRRGSGKSTLLRRLQVEVDTNEALASDYIAVNLAEEQANIYRLFDLLEEIVRELEYRRLEIEWPEADDATDYSDALFLAIHNALGLANKKLVLLLDNIDRIFESLGEEAALLRAYLQNYNDIKIVGGSTRMTEHFWAYNKAFYDFFRVLHLRPLDNEEVKQLLLYWGEQLKSPVLKDFVESRPGQLETIRIMTDGLPRTLQFFVNILLTHSQETGYEYICLLMDKVTPLYQERLNHLPPSQRKIVLQMAFYWEAAGAKELARAARMENRVISAQLNQLIGKGVAEKIETKTKNYLYRLSERFFNLWLIFTQGSPREKRRARYLTIFLENFYNAEELNELALIHWRDLKENGVIPNKAALLTKAYSQSSSIPFWLRDSLIEETRQLATLDISLKNELPSTTGEILRTVFTLVDRREWKKAENLIATIEQEGGIKEYMMGYLSERRKDLSNAAEYLFDSSRKGFESALGPLATVYLRAGDLELAEKYAELAFQKKHRFSAGILSLIYYEQNKNKQKALSILKDAVESNPDDRALCMFPILKAWNGDFNGLAEVLNGLVRERNPYQAYTLSEMMVHYQDELVRQIFESNEFGTQLSEQFLPLHMVAKLVYSDEPSGFGKIPPEIRNTIDKMLIYIYKKRDFYYGAREAE